MVKLDEPHEFASPDCPGCSGGDKVPANAEYWQCPICDAEWGDEEYEIENDCAGWETALMDEDLNGKLWD